MPLDTGAVANDLNSSWGVDQESGLNAPSIDDGPHIGFALRSIREFNGLSLEDISHATRIRRHYLSSIEGLNLDPLPSRPFTVGYVRAYAVALGQDGERAVARFRRDAPDPDETLHAPVGVRRESDPRLMLVAVLVAVVVGGILIWNFVERAMTAPTPSVAAVAASPAKTVYAPPAQAEGPVSLGAPLPAPQESTTPKPYVTPGLEGQMSTGQPQDVGAIADAQAAAAGLDETPPVGSPFEAKGAVYGDPNVAGAVILQARKPVSLTVHRADGSISFARFLSVGQAFRAPTTKGWTVQVSEPASVDVFVDGVLKGPMPAPAAAIADLAKPDDPPAQ